MAREELDNYLMPDEPSVKPNGKTRPRLDGFPDLTLDIEVPASIESEKTILGGVLLDNSNFAEALEGLQASDFVLDSHRVIWKRMEALRAKGTQIDIVTLANEFGQNAIMEIGGVSYLASLTEGMPRRIAIGDYVRIVAEKSLARKVQAACQVAWKKASQDSAGDVIASLTEAIAQASAECKVKLIYTPRRQVFEEFLQFATSGNAEVDWAVWGVMQRGSSGLILADPGIGKSLLCCHLALHLISGTPWLGCSVPVRMRGAIISREDYHGETSRRLAQLTAGCELYNTHDLEDWLYINTRKQTATFDLQREQDVSEMIEAMKDLGCQFAIFDVFRRLWNGDENDNAEVSRVLASLTRIQTEVGCSVILVHHLRKGEGSTIFHRSRGSTAIEGWREFALGITLANPDNEDPANHVRKIEFYTKAALPHIPIYYRICSNSSSTAMRFERDEEFGRPGKKESSKRTAKTLFGKEYQS